MSPESLTAEDMQARLDFFLEELDIGERHVRYAETQIRRCTVWLMGQLEFEFE